MTISVRSLVESSKVRRLVALAGAALPVLFGACSQTPVTVDLHSLQESGNVSFVCRANDGSATGHKLDECPDLENATRHLLGLVTQTATDEVAIVDVYAGSVVDVDPSTPGYSFLRVGARPGAIVTSPGGAASFVGVSGLNKNGVFALPTTCLSPPENGQPPRDLTSWSACALSSAPGDMAVVVDDAGSCGAEPEVDQSRHSYCPADLTHEQPRTGRRKLLVALPEEHELVVLDAQSLLDRPPGEFQACVVEKTIALGAAKLSSSAMPALPDDLKPLPDAPNTCQTTQYPPPSTSALPTPGGFALSGTQLYVADLALPVVHVLDVSSPCGPKDETQLLPRSYLTPNRQVTTSRLAVSPLTPTGQQFVYAVDNTDQPTASVMVFDVSPPEPGKMPVTPYPLIFSGSPRQPFLAPDRLLFSAPVRDVAFVMRDFPAPATDTGVGAFGAPCDPYPNSTSPGIQYRPNSDFTAGAGPRNLRGLFGFAMLTNGQIAIIDVEDFDEQCRRPVTSNALKQEDFRGCAKDHGVTKQSPPPAYFTVDGLASSVPTVTNESSCKVIEPHRPRANTLSISSATVGLGAPTLRSFPQFSNPDPATMTAADQQPHLLAVDFPNPDPSNATPIRAQVNISSQVYANCVDTEGRTITGSTPPPPLPCDGSAPQLPVDPLTSLENSLVLPLNEPRSYAQSDAPVLTFEGRVFPPRPSGFLQTSANPTRAVLHDPDANFCSAGVEDSDTISSEAAELGIPAANLKAWSKAHADYVEITGDFPVVDDFYWTGKSCSLDSCQTEFGTVDNPEVLSVSRDLSILEASGDQLVVTPRCADGTAVGTDECDAKGMLNDLRCCFPAGTSYTVRASHQWLLGSVVNGTFVSGLNDVASGADGRCVHTASCDRRKQYFHSRAFEVCDLAALPKGASCSDDQNVACTVDGTHSVKNADGTSSLVATVPPVQPGGDGKECIFENLTSRFVVYRGTQPSTRGMSFSWQTTGGFAPLTMTLATQSTQVNPQSMSYVPEIGYLAVVDGSTLGLALFDLNALAVASPSPYF